MSKTKSHSSVAAAQAALDACPLPQVRRLRVESAENGLLIMGRVESFYMKQRAQETLRALIVDLQLINQVEVDRASDDTLGSGEQPF